MGSRTDAGSPKVWPVGLYAASPSGRVTGQKAEVDGFFAAARTEKGRKPGSFITNQVEIVRIPAVCEDR